MKQLKYFLLPLFLLLLLAGCANRYRPASNGGYGYSEQAIRPDVFLVKFQGNSSLRREEARELALYRAAELTAERGYDYFYLIDAEETQEISPWGASSYNGVEMQGGVPIARLKIHMSDGDIPEENPRALDPHFLLNFYDVD